MISGLKPDGRMAVVLDTGALNRGSGDQGSNKERAIRKRFVDEDLIEAVVLLPENLFYNTTSPGIVMVVNRRKRYPREILLVNASKLFSKGRPKNYLGDTQLEEVVRLYRDWACVDGLTAVVTASEAARADYNLSPSRYIVTGAQSEALPLEEAVVLFEEAEEERAEADLRLRELLARLGFPR